MFTSSFAFFENSAVVIRRQLDYPYEIEACWLDFSGGCFGCDPQFGQRPARFTQDRRFLPRSCVPIHNRKMTAGFEGVCNAVGEASPFRYAMKRIRQKNKIHLLRYMHRYVVGVTFNKIAIHNAAFGKALLAHIQQIDLDINRDNMARNLGNL